MDTKKNQPQQQATTSEADLIKQSAIKKAEIFTDCISSAAISIDSLNQNNLDVNTLIDRLGCSVSQIKEGNIEEIEAILITQALTLNALVHRSLIQTGNSDYIPKIEAYSDIAFKAQNQCLKTVAVLAELKHPRRATFIKQQNNAVNQQVNNEAETENQKKPANELLEVNHDRRLDIGTTTTPITTNPQMAAMEIGGGEDSRR